MRNRIFAVLALAILAGGGLAYGTYNVINTPAGEDRRGADAARSSSPPADLQLGAELKKEDLTVVNFPKGQAPEGAFAKPGRHRRPRPDRARWSRTSRPRRQAGVEGSRRRPAAGHSRGHARGVGARQRSDRRRRLRAAGHAASTCSRPRARPSQPQDTTSKVILSNVQVLTAGTRLEQDQEKGKPMQVTVVTLLVYPGAGRAPRAREHRRQDSARAAQPARQGAPETPGIKHGGAARPRRRPAPRATGPRVQRAQGAEPGPSRRQRPRRAPLPTVEMIRGDKRTAEVIK